MKIKQKKQILYDAFIQVCLKEIKRQKNIAIGAPTPEIMSESEKYLSMCSKIPIIGGLINTVSFVGQALISNQEKFFAERINKIFGSFGNSKIELLSAAITEITNSIEENLLDLQDQQKIEEIAVLAYRKLFDFLKANNLNEEALTINKIIEIIQHQDTMFCTDIFYIAPNQEIIIKEFQNLPIKKPKIADETSENDDLTLNSEHFRINRIEQDIYQLQKNTQKHTYLLEVTKAITEIQEQYFYNAKAVTVHFVGRNDQLDEIHKYFLANQDGIQVIGGLGGMGKTQLVLQYINLYKAEYNNRIRCFTASTQESLDFEFKEFAQTIGISTSNRNSKEVIKLVKIALESRIEHSFLVFDNLVDYNLLENYLPNTGAPHQHHIMIITQNTMDYSGLSIHNNMNIISLDKLSDNEAYEYIKKNIQDASRENALKLSKLFDNIPLGLSQSVAFIKTNSLEIKQYLKEHQKIQKNNPHQLSEVLFHSKSDPHKDNLYITLSMSLKKISEIEPKAFEILTICSYLNADRIPNYLFDILFENTIETSKMIAVLEGYSLISLQKIGKINFIDVHRIAQEVIRDMIVNEDYSIMIKTMDLVHNQLENDIDIVVTLKKRQALLQHLISLIDNYNSVTNKFLDLNKIAVRIYNDCGNVYFSFLQLDKAKAYYQQALQIGSSIYGENSKQTATILCNLAAISQALKKPQDAITQYENILLIYTSLEITEFQKRAIIFCKIAYNYLMMHQNELAFNKYNEALVIYENTNGYSEEIADTIYAIANVYLSSGNYLEAITKYDHALTVYTQVFGAKSSKVAEIINAKGNTHRISRNYEIALEQYNLAIKINKIIYSDQHLSVAINMRGICKSYYAMNRYDEALVLYELVLPIFIEVFTEEHLMVGKIIYEIGNIYKKQHKNIKALECFNKALQIYQNTYGIEHRETIEVSSNIQKLNEIDFVQVNLEENQESSQNIKRSISIENKSPSQTQDGLSSSLDWLAFIEDIEDSQKSHHNSQELTVFSVINHYYNPILSSSLFLYVMQNIKIERTKIISALIEIGNDHEVANMLIEASQEYGEEYVIKLLFESNLDDYILYSNMINKINSFVDIKDMSEWPGYVQYVHNAISNNHFSSFARKALDIISKLIDMLEDSLNISEIFFNENMALNDIIASITLQLEYVFDVVASGQNFLSFPLRPSPHFVPDGSFDGGEGDNNNINDFYTQDLANDNQMFLFVLGDYNSTSL